MDRLPTIGGNWKLNLDPSASAALARDLVHKLSSRGSTHVVLFPTAISLVAVVDAVRGSGIDVGIQDVHTDASGAFTGANSAALSRSAGATRALVGHSERRHVFGDTDTLVHDKLRACLDAGLLPTLCVGETLAQRDQDRTVDVLTAQLQAGLGDLPRDRVATITLAYEPVWAIGTGRSATPQQAQDVHAAIRAWLGDRYGAHIAGEMRIQYGGSVKPTNAAQIMACPDIDGALVGGAALDAEALAAIVAAAS